MSPEVAYKVQSAYIGTRNVGRIGLSAFSHGRKWRDDLNDASILEIVDRSETAGWLISDEGMESLIGRIEDLEIELEQAHISSLLAAREGRNKWTRGEKLASAAKASAHKRKAAIEEATNGNKR